MLPILVVFGPLFTDISVNKDLIFRRLSINMDGSSRNWQRIVKNGQFPATIPSDPIPPFPGQLSSPGQLSAISHSAICPQSYRSCASYYGRTTRNLVVRCRGHLEINKAGQKIKSSPSTIGDNISKFGHDESFENFEVISRTDNSFDLHIHDSLLILRDRPMLKSQLSYIPLALF